MKTFIWFLPALLSVDSVLDTTFPLSSVKTETNLPTVLTNPLLRLIVFRYHIQAFHIYFSEHLRIYVTFLANR